MLTKVFEWHERYDRHVEISERGHKGTLCSGSDRVNLVSHLRRACLRAV